MFRVTTILILLTFAVGVVVIAQDPPKDAPKTEQLAVELKSGEEVSGALKKVDEDGITIVGDDKIALFLRWGFVRGDKHFELRKRAANYSKVDSLLKLADFCHDFAMDKEEGEVLKAADGLEPGNAEIARRRSILDGQPLQPVTPDKPPVVPPDKPPVVPPDKPPARPPVSGNVKLKLVIEKEDAAATEYLTTKLEELGYAVATGADYSHQVKITLTLTVTRNPSFFGGQLYALVDGSLAFSLTDKGGAEMKSSSYDVKDVRSEARDAKAQAQKSAREQLIDKLVPDLDKILSPLKK